MDRTRKAKFPFLISPLLLFLVSSDGFKYQFPLSDLWLTQILGENIELFSATMYEGAVHTGWFVYTVKVDDPNPLLETVGVWLPRSLVLSHKSGLLQVDGHKLKGFYQNANLNMVTFA